MVYILSKQNRVFNIVTLVSRLSQLRLRITNSKVSMSPYPLHMCIIWGLCMYNIIVRDFQWITSTLYTKHRPPLSHKSFIDNIIILTLTSTARDCTWWHAFGRKIYIMYTTTIIHQIKNLTLTFTFCIFLSLLSPQFEAHLSQFVANFDQLVVLMSCSGA